MTNVKAKQKYSLTCRFKNEIFGFVMSFNLLWIVKRTSDLDLVASEWKFSCTNKMQVLQNLARLMQNVVNFPHIGSGADLGFSRGGRRLFKRFLRSTALIFSSSPYAQFSPCFSQNFCAAGEFCKNRPKNPFLGTFWKMLTKKLRFFGALPPPPLKISI